MALTQSLTLSNGVKMPQLGLGVWQSKVGKETEDAVSWAVKTGYRHIDTAAIYKNEESVGKAIAACNVPREELFITTKLWNVDQGYESTLKAFDDSLKRLGLTHVDLYLIHWPGKDKYLDTWRAFEKLYEEKKVRAIGLSNFQKNHIEDILKHCKVRPMVNQVELHPLNNQKELREYCKEKDIVVTAWSPLGQGQLLADAKLKSIGQKYSKTPAQVILRWELQHGVVTIPKSVHEERIKENSKIFDFELKPEDMKTIDEMNTNHRFGPHPDTFMMGFE
ncbi:NADP-dependent oxidoreductase domain [Trypanosoma melophagium]|uniref:NADP-dependent oxidoreductase domain n=1 Tax=Trypanosoma melophagium TaxID=715481 RepID=UPI00351A33B0|nr:NADP-dependent oxidoreductase domain [Trypanosoma melophagium]